MHSIKACSRIFVSYQQGIVSARYRYLFNSTLYCTVSVKMLGLTVCIVSRCWVLKNRRLTIQHCNIKLSGCLWQEECPNLHRAAAAAVAAAAAATATPLPPPPLPPPPQKEAFACQISLYCHCQRQRRIKNKAQILFLSKQ